MTSSIANMTHTAGWARAATMPALLIILAIVVGLAAFSFGTSMGQSDTTAFDADIRSVQSMLDAYRESEPSAIDADVRSVQAILDSHSAGG